MLKQRVITALLLATGFLACLFFLSWPLFALIIGCVLALGAWEWSRLSSLQSLFAQVGYAAVVALVAVALGWWCAWGQDLAHLRMLLMVACLWWVLALLWIQSYPASAVLWGSASVRLVMGLFVLVPAWLGCLYIRQEPSGHWLVLLVVFVVAAADIGAYFTGRAFGKTKLAFNVSPGKSWEGVAGGAVFAFVVAAAFNVFWGGNAWGALFVIVVPTALISVVGDLLESMIKRHRGVKDSSQLLPGHGGVLDRIDGLVAAIPVFALLYLLSSWRLLS